MINKINAVYDALKELDMKPTPNNTSIMAGVYRVLKEVYAELNEKEGADDGRIIDAEQRDGD